MNEGEVGMKWSDAGEEEKDEGGDEGGEEIASS